MDRAELDATIAALDRAFPDGWRSGDKTCDALTVLMAYRTRRLVASMLAARPR